jgi:hypothetical protein
LYSRTVYRLAKPSSSSNQLETYLDEGVHGEDDQLWLSLGVVHEIQIYQLLLLQVVRLLGGQLMPFRSGV